MNPSVAHQPDSRFALMRLCVTLLPMTIGSSGMYIVVVTLPAVQAEFGVMLPLLPRPGGASLGGWMSDKVFDLTGSYHAAFINGIGWNLLNLAVVVLLLHRVRRGGVPRVQHATPGTAAA